MKKRTFKIIGLFLLCFLFYEVAGALLPFVFPPKISKEFRESVDTSAFYSDETGPDRAAIVETSIEALNSRIEMIHQAKERIVLSTFDIRDGESCRDIFSSLLEAADRGIQVQVLKPWTLNGRLHDKYILVDDKLLLLGGRNTFDYFLGEYDAENLSYDRDVLIFRSGLEGDSSIDQVDAYFRSVWDLEYCETVFSAPPKDMEAQIKDGEMQLRDHYKQMISANPLLAQPDIDYTARTMAVNKVTLISNPTHIMCKEPRLWYQLRELMWNAKERVYLQTPYAVLGDAMYTGMEITAQVVPEFTMMINAAAVGDNFMASSDYTLNRGRILNTGVGLYEYFGDRSSHGKSMLIDHDISLIGSYNLDMRSTYVDTETMLVIHGEEFNACMEKNILELQKDSVKVNPDGTYVPDPDVTIAEVPAKKKAIFKVSSLLFQLIRYLI